LKLNLYRGRTWRVQLYARERKRERKRESTRKLQQEYISLGAYNEGISDVTGRLTHSVAFDKKRQKRAIKKGEPKKWGEKEEKV